MALLKDFKDLKGHILIDIIVDRSYSEIVFILSSGARYKLYHQQSCCESVGIEDINGDIQDLIGLPILLAEESSNSTDPAPDNGEWGYRSYTWTFYKLATNRGYVTIRWFGSSNGYYSESVDWDRC
jgi:hypothetical protein